MDFYVVGTLENSKGELVKAQIINLTYLEVALSDCELTATSFRIPNWCMRTQSIVELKALKAEKDIHGKPIHDFVNVREINNKGIVLKANYKVDTLKKIETGIINKKKNAKAIVHALFIIRGRTENEFMPKLDILVTCIGGMLYLYYLRSIEQEKFSDYRRSNWKVIKDGIETKIVRNYANDTQLREFRFHDSNAVKLKSYKHGELSLNRDGEYVFLHYKEARFEVCNKVKYEWLLYRKGIAKLDVNVINAFGLHYKKQREDLVLSTRGNFKTGTVKIATRLNNEYFEGSISERNILCANGLAVVKTTTKHVDDKVEKTIGCLNLNRLVTRDLVNYSDGALNELILKSYVVPPIFDACEGRAKNLEFKVPKIKYEDVFNKIPEAYIFTLRCDADFHRIYQLGYIGTAYFPTTKKLLPLKYYSLICARTNTGTYSIAGFYKAKGANKKLSNFMDIIDGKTGVISESIELSSSNIDSVIDKYTNSTYDLSGNITVQNTNLYTIGKVKEIVKKMCKIDEAI